MSLSANPRIFGVFYAVAGHYAGQRLVFGARLAVVTSLMLLGAMAPKAIRTKAPVPTLMTVLGLLGLFFYSQKWNRI
ncbi:hypothetical protein HDU91_007270 [Kappamyces sp. JEL0680]|nr:hypothetical protein HDU91_007270 [Kappamyces sp. JEL0680]